MRKGDIVVSGWAGEGNPARVFMVEEVGPKFTKVLYEADGHLETDVFSTSYLRLDKEHYKVVGHIDIESPVIIRLRAEKNLLAGADKRKKEAGGDG